LFGIDDSDSHEDDNENDDSKYESPFKPFPLLNALSDLMMLPFDMLADSSMRKEVWLLLIFRLVFFISIYWETNFDFLYAKNSIGLS
jgi:hypothetical protein